MSYFSAIGNSPYPYTMPYQNDLPRAGTAEEEDKSGVNGIKKPSTECQTCKERKYQDGSNEMVSFKSPTHLSPESAGVAVRAHEQEHVRNAYTKASQGNGKVVSANVAIHTATCPECGRSYVSGGLTTTKIKYSDESNPYQQNKKALDHANIVGTNADYAV